MIKKTKEILNEFGGPGGRTATRCNQISPATLFVSCSRRSGAWVLQNNNNNASNCATNCANNCANNVGSWVGFRRALFAFPIPDNKTENVLPNSAGLCNQIKYGLYQEGQSRRISFDGICHRASKPSNCCGNVHICHFHWQ